MKGANWDTTKLHCTIASLVGVFSTDSYWLLEMLLCASFSSPGPFWPSCLSFLAVCGLFYIFVCFLNFINGSMLCKHSCCSKIPHFISNLIKKEFFINFYQLIILFFCNFPLHFARLCYYKLQLTVSISFSRDWKKLWGEINCRESFIAY